ncbi:MAG: hypothetical protein ACOCXQ_04355 [Patescibacteria group bacterium]
MQEIEWDKLPHPSRKAGERKLVVTKHRLSFNPSSAEVVVTKINSLQVEHFKPHLGKNQRLHLFLVGMAVRYDNVRLELYVHDVKLIVVTDERELEKLYL